MKIEYHVFFITKEKIMEAGLHIMVGRRHYDAMETYSSMILPSHSWSPEHIGCIVNCVCFDAVKTPLIRCIKDVRIYQNYDDLILGENHADPIIFQLLKEFVSESNFDHNRQVRIAEFVRIDDV